MTKSNLYSLMLALFHMVFSNTGWAATTSPSWFIKSLTEICYEAYVPQFLRQIERLDLSQPVDSLSAVGQLFDVDYEMYCEHATASFNDLGMSCEIDYQKKTTATHDMLKRKLLSNFDFSTRALKVHDDVVSVIHVLDTNTILTGSSDKTLKLWKLQAVSEIDDYWRCEQTFYGHQDRILAALKLNNSILISSDFKQTIRLWDITTGKCLAYFSLNDNAYSLTKINDHMFATGKACATDIWDVRYGNECTCQKIFSDINLRNPIGTGSYKVVGVSESVDKHSINYFNFDGKTTKTVVEDVGKRFEFGVRVNETILVYADRYHGNLIIVDTATGKFEEVMNTYKANSYTIEKIHDSMVAVGGGKGISVWDLNAKTCKITFGNKKWGNAGKAGLSYEYSKHRNQAFAVARYNEHFIVGSNGKDGEIRFWDLRLMNYNILQLILFLRMKQTNITPDKLDPEWREVYESLRQ